MRKRVKKYGKLKISIMTAAIGAAAVGAYIAVPPIARAAFGIGSIDFSSEPENYAGDYSDDFFGILGEEIVTEPLTESETRAETAEEITAETGPKPYPKKWKEDKSCTVYPYTFERYSGNKYFGLEKGGQVANETDIPNSSLMEESRIAPDFTISLDGSPQVLIMHTHTTESFEPYERDFFDKSFNYRTTDNSKNVVAVGDRIAEQLEDEGIGVVHDSTVHDYPSYNGSYDRSAVTVKSILEQYPTIKVVLDIHRDAVGTSDSIMQPTLNINGKKAAQVMIISGCDDGTMDMPDYIKNFRFACCLQSQMASDYPGLARPILFDYRRYNQDITTGSLLIEVGSHGNTIEQAEYAGELIGKSLAKILKGLV